MPRFNAKIWNSEMDKHIETLEYRRVTNMFKGQDPEDILELAQLYTVKKDFVKSKELSEFYMRLCHERSLDINLSVYKYLGLAALSADKKWEAYGFIHQYIKKNKAPDADIEKTYQDLRAELYPAASK